MSFDWLFSPVEWIDGHLEEWATGAPVWVALLLAALLGLRHATDPDHVMAIVTLQGTEGSRVRGAARLGAWWGIGHAATLLVVGVPLIALDDALPGPVQAWSERLVGVLIVALALRAAIRWWRGRPLRAAGATAPAPLADRTPAAAFGIGVLHGLAGTGAVVLLVLATLPSTATAYLALAVFAPMSVVSMAACSAAWGWLATRISRSRVAGDLFAVAASTFALLFGVWYVAAV